jgi:hypothetical protein
MKFNKKAAMELGISTVVMLVIAIVIIGAGIAFIRGFFGQGTETLGGAFEVADFGLEPSASDPLVLTDGQVKIKRGREATVRVGFYNKDNNAFDVNIVFGQCVTSSPTQECGDRASPRIVSLEQKVEPGESAGFATQVTAMCADEDDPNTVYNMNPGTYTCNLLAMGSTVDQNNYNVELARRQIIFTVTS